MKNNNLHKIQVLLALGSNIGDRVSYIRQAIDLLKEINAVDSLKISSYYVTEPYGVSNQNWYINAAISGYTTLSETSLLSICKSIEYYLGRQIRSRWSEREIDIDILFYGNKIAKNKLLEIPHPEIHLRKFVLQPLDEIEPNFIHPILLKSVSYLLQHCKDNLQVIKDNE
ncbi:MAG: 2-amino-4-hydroxy-6-hydroxymethyldihydropteridine diphosphokinase [Candidatus Kapaibacteriota bacterium]